MGTRKRLRLHLLQDLQALLVMSFLDLQHTLHEVHFIDEGGVGVGDKVFLEVLGQHLIPSVKASLQRQIALLHLARLGEEGCN